MSDKVYTSNFTGSQIDEAVGKVINNEIGGEAIKEGSIPLSALSQEVKDKIENAGADWNAKEGESGYIENKPFFSPIDEQEFLTWRDDNTIDTDLDANHLIIKIGNFNSNRTIDVKTYNVESSLKNKPFYFFYKGYRYTITYQNYNLRVLDESGRHAIDGINVKIYNYEIGYDNNVKLLDSAYLSDNVIKTTPQELSADDKNQALANLGIDPVVWKYMCNPHIMTYYGDSGSCYNAIPKELSDIIYQNGEFNQLVLSTVLIKSFYEVEGSNAWKIERITSYNENGIVTFANAEFIYDPNTRLFVV